MALMGAVMAASGQTGEPNASSGGQESQDSAKPPSLFHRVLQDFMAQGGDPTGTGMGGPGYEFENEDSDLKFDKEGVVAMANAGRDTNGSQFFITFGPQDYLNGGYTIFGQVIQGMDVVRNIKLRDPDTNPDYPGDAIDTVTITEQ